MIREPKDADGFAVERDTILLLQSGEQRAAHIHVEVSERTAKFWLDPVQLARSNGFRPHELTRLRALVIEYRYRFLEAWHAHFDSSA